MIGSDLEGADLESRVASWATSPSRQSGQPARGRSRSALPARRNQRVSGSCSFWNARKPLEDHAVHAPADAGAVRRGLLRHLTSPLLHPASGTFRSRLRSPSTTRLRLRRRLPARTGAVQVDAGVAAFPLDQLMLSHLHLHRRQVKHLAALHRRDRPPRQARPAPGTRPWLMPLLPVRPGHLRQRLARVPILPARLTPGLLPQRP